MFLCTHSRHKRSSFLCHAGLLGILRKIYTSLGHSCEPNHISGLKTTLRRMGAGLRFSQSMMSVLNGKIIYILKTTDSLTTKLNRVVQDLRIVDHTFKEWQEQLTQFAAKSNCHDSIALEFFSKHSSAIDRALTALLRLTEIQDVLHLFSTLDTKTLFGFAHLPPFLQPQILSRLATASDMTFCTQALKEGFPLFLNPMVDIEHHGNHIEASVLLTVFLNPMVDIEHYGNHIEASVLLTVPEILT